MIGLSDQRSRTRSPASSRDAPADAAAHEPLGTGPFAERLLRGIDWFIPLDLQNETTDRIRQVRLTVAIGILSGIAVQVTLTAASSQPDSAAIRALSHTYSFILLATPLIIKAHFPIAWIQNGLTGVMFGYATFLAATTGGADTGGLFVAILAPLLAVLMCGPRAGLIWSALGCIAFGTIAIAVGNGYDAPVHPDQDEVALWSLWAGIVGIISTVGIAVTYEWLNASTFRALASARALAEREQEERLSLERAFSSELEKLVEERTQQLEESRGQLRQADRLASIGTLAAGVAHQINNPVGSILIAADFALMVEEPAEREAAYRHALESNMAEARRCGKIVHQLLRFARNNSEERAAFDLNLAVQRAIDSLGETQNRIKLQLADTPLQIDANAIEIEQVIVNLISNALQADPDTVTVATKRERSKAILQVRDHGPGIDEEDLHRVFDPFFTTRLNNGGTGLGLSIAHSIISEHGGTIAIDSEAGSGAQFTVMLDSSVPPSL